jgi:hypothetical protein
VGARAEAHGNPSSGESDVSHIVEAAGGGSVMVRLEKKVVELTQSSFREAIDPAGP